MRIERYSGDEARAVLVAMATDDTVLARIASVWKPNLFGSRWADLVGSWCVRFHTRYGTAPGPALEDSFRLWASKTRDEDTIKLVESFLVALSAQAESSSINPEHLIDVACRHFDRVRLTRAAEEIRAHLDRGDLEAAERARAESGKTELGSSGWVDVLNCPEVWKAGLEQSVQPPLIPLEGALREFFDHPDCLHRDCFVAFMGQKGSKKSHWLIELAWRAMTGGHRVAFFSVGDMTQLQLMNRFVVKATQMPLRVQTVRWPTRIGGSQDEHLHEYEERAFPRALTHADAVRVMGELHRQFPDRLRVSCHPSRSISVNGIEAVLQAWSSQGWCPDCVVVDYADILAKCDPKEEHRDAINTTWTLLRSLSQKLHCLVLTATQTDAASYKAMLLDRTNFTDDRRKIDHVNAMVGINATHKEKLEGRTRLNLLALREGNYDEHRCVHVAGCIPLGQVAVLSSW